MKFKGIDRNQRDVLLYTLVIFFKTEVDEDFCHWLLIMVRSEND